MSNDSDIIAEQISEAFSAPMMFLFAMVIPARKTPPMPPPEFSPNPASPTSGLQVTGAGLFESIKVER